jgi:hypothetical protein
LCGTVAVTLSVASTALGAPKGPQRATIFGPEVEETGNTCSGGATATAKTFGTVVLDTPGNETTVTGKLALKRATPRATFQVTLVEQEPQRVGCQSFFVGMITTNKKGSAKLQFSVKRALAGPTRFWVSAAEQSPFVELLASSAVELD